MSERNEGKKEKRRGKTGRNEGREGEYMVLELQRSIINAEKRSITLSLEMRQGDVNT